MTHEIEIRRTLPDDMRAQASDILEDAFGSKLRMVVPDRARRVAFVAAALRAEHVVVALRDRELLGLVGLSSRGEPYAGGLLAIGWDPRPHVEHLGWLGATWAVLSLRVTDHRPRADEIYVDGVAVSPTARGQGVGTLLLAEVAAVAREQGQPFVRLDVIDTNPRAQALYERLGYRVTGIQSFRLKRHWTGFGAIISMELAVPPGEPPPATTTGHDRRPRS